MKIRSCTVSIALVLFTIGISFAGQFGPAEPAAKEGMTSMGVGYFYSESKMKSSNIGDLVFKSSQVYLQGSYSFVRNWEVYGRIGGANMKEQVSNFDDSMKVFGSLGVRGLLYNDGLFSVGPFIQGNMYSNYSDTVTSGGATGRFTVENPWDGSVGLATQIKKDNFSVYYGPFAYIARNEVKVEAPFGNLLANGSATLKEKQNLGVFLGINAVAIKDFNIGIEGQYTGRFSVGGMANYSF